MPKNAYVMLMMHADGYLPGVLVAAFSLIKTQTTADIVIMVTPDVSQEARQQIDTLNTEKNKVIIWPVPYIQYNSKPLKSARVRELYPWIKTSYTKWNALTLPYDKVILLDADMLVIKNIDHLFDMQTPAALFNSAFARPCGTLPARYTVAAVDAHGFVPHGALIPHALITKELKTGPLVGMSSVMVLTPNVAEFTHLCEVLELAQPFGFPAVYNGHDEQSIAWFYATILQRDFYNIHQRYSMIQFKKNYLPKGDQPYILHYFSDQKPWHIICDAHYICVENVTQQTPQKTIWPDFLIWLDTYKELNHNSAILAANNKN